MSDLKRCPFCGGVPKKDFDGYMLCTACLVGLTQKTWNTRPTESALLAALKAVQDEFIAKDGTVTATTMIGVRDAIKLAGG